MLIANVPKEPDLALGHEHGYAQGMYGRIAEPFVVKPTASVKPVEVFLIGFTAEIIEVPNLEIREELTIVVVAVIVCIKQPI